uniref:MYB-CC type transcription factor LHEQLE-containing domain-containing protein n=1 Tax=Oryza barthii TaxID=65489 RepID=A0A0D3FI21_9ORYZ
MSSSLPILPKSLKDIPRSHNTQNILMPGQLPNDSMPLHQSATQSSISHPRASVVRSSYSAMLGYAANPIDSVSSHEGHFMAAPFISQSSNAEMLQSLCNNNTHGGHTVPTFFPAPACGAPDYMDTITVPDNHTQSGSSTVTSDAAKQNEWWADIMNDDWKDILDATATDSQSKKYRTARYKPDLSEGKTQEGKTTDELSLDLKASMDLTEALRLQMEVQKRLHEQLEIQRKLQLRIEEQGKYLQKMFEKQCKSSTQSVQDPSSGDTATPSEPSNSVDKDSEAALDPNRIGDNHPKNSTNVGANLKTAATESPDSPVIATDGSVLPQEKCRRVHES